MSSTEAPHRTEQTHRLISGADRSGAARSLSRRRDGEESLQPTRGASVLPAALRPQAAAPAIPPARAAADVAPERGARLSLPAPRTTSQGARVETPRPVAGSRDRDSALPARQKPAPRHPEATAPLGTRARASPQRPAPGGRAPVRPRGAPPSLRAPLTGFGILGVVRAAAAASATPDTNVHAAPASPLPSAPCGGGVGGRSRSRPRRQRSPRVRRRPPGGGLSMAGGARP